MDAEVLTTLPWLGKSSQRCLMSIMKIFRTAWWTSIPNRAPKRWSRHCKEDPKGSPLPQVRSLHQRMVTVMFLIKSIQSIMRECSSWTAACETWSSLTMKSSMDMDCNALRGWNASNWRINGTTGLAMPSNDHRLGSETYSYSVMKPLGKGSGSGRKRWESRPIKGCWNHCLEEFRRLRYI